MIQQIDNTLVPLLPSPQTITASWVDLGVSSPLGPWIDAMDCDVISLWIKVLIHSSQNV